MAEKTKASLLHTAPCWSIQDLTACLLTSHIQSPVSAWQSYTNNLLSKYYIWTWWIFKSWQRQHICFSVLNHVICWLNICWRALCFMFMFTCIFQLPPEVYSIRPPRIQLTPAVNLEPMWKTFLTRHTSTKQRENKYNFTLLGFKCHDSNVCSHSPQRKDCVQGLLGKKRSPIGVKDVRTGWRADRGWFLPRQWPPQRQ